MAVSAKVGRTPKCLRVWLENDPRFSSCLQITPGRAEATPLLLLPFFVISVLRYDVMGTIIRQGISVL
jgi:hypothetical protein